MRRIIDRRNKEKFQIDDLYLNGYAKHCGINATGVYVVMCRHVDKNQECFPSHKMIAEKLGISERSVYGAIKTLESWSIINIEERKRRADGSFLNQTYILLDKSFWKSLPLANNAGGSHSQIMHQPLANNDKKDDRHIIIGRKHIKKETHTKISVADNPFNYLINQWEIFNPKLLESYPKFLSLVDTEISTAAARGWSTDRIAARIKETAGKGIKPWDLFGKNETPREPVQKFKVFT